MVFIIIKTNTQVREELINMLQNKETEQSRELSILQQDLEHRMKIVDEVRRAHYCFFGSVLLAFAELFLVCLLHILFILNYVLKAKILSTKFY